MEIHILHHGGVCIERIVFKISRFLRIILSKFSCCVLVGIIVNLIYYHSGCIYYLLRVHLKCCISTVSKENLKSN